MTSNESKKDDEVDNDDDNNRLMVDGVSGVVQGDGDNSFVLLSVAKMEELGLFRGDSVLIKGKKHHSTVCFALANEQTDSGKIRMNGVIRKNLGVKLGDVVSLYSAGEVKYGTCIHVLPVEDSGDGITGSLLDTYLKPYFQDSYRPAMKGDYFIVHGKNHFGQVRDVEFKVIEFEVKEEPDEDVCIVAPETLIHCDSVLIKEINSVKNENAAYAEQINCLTQQINELQKRSNKDKEEVLLYQQQIQELKHNLEDSQNEKKEIEIEVVKLREENMKLKIANIDVSDYENWTSEQFVHWIMSLQDGRFAKYKITLQEIFKKENIDGACIADIEGADIKSWGIDDFRDRKGLLKEMKELIENNKNNKNKKGYGDNIPNEGANAPTAYI